MSILGRRPFTKIGVGVAGFIIALAVALGFARQNLEGQAKNSTPMAPVFEVDPLWPKPLPNHWVLGSLGGIAVTTRITSGC